MSTQTVQYLMYGVSLPYKWHEEWEIANPDKPDFYEHFSSKLGFMEDNAFEPGVTHKDGIFCLFDGRDGRFIIIGRVLARAHNGKMIADEAGPLEIPTLTDLERELIENSVTRNFGVDGPFSTYIVTAFR